MSDLISIVIPTYNREKKIERAIKSVLSQTYKNIEVIVVDDFSEDDTASVLQSLQKKNKNIKFVVNQRGKGASGARNTGILNASGKYIAFLDSDDEYTPEHIGVRYALVANGISNIVLGDFELIDELTNEGLGRFSQKKTILPRVHKEDCGGYFIFKENLALPLIQENFFHLGTVMLSCQLARQTLLREDVVFAEDRDFGIRLSMNNRLRFSYIKNPTYKLYRHDFSLTSAVQLNNLKRWQDMTLLYKDYLNNIFFDKKEKDIIKKELKKIVMTRSIYYRKNNKPFKSISSSLDSFMYGFSFSDYKELAKSILAPLLSKFL